MSESRTTFRPDPLWLIDALADDLKQISRLDDAPEEEMLYERGLTLIGRAFPAAARYALEAFGVPAGTQQGDRVVQPQ